MWWIFGGKNVCQFSPSKYGLKICHQYFTTFFTMQYTTSKEICHLLRGLVDSCREAHATVANAPSAHSGGRSHLIFEVFQTRVAYFCFCLVA